MMPSWLLFLAVLAAEDPSSAEESAPPMRKPVDRVSEALLSENEAWTTLGFRLQVGLAREKLPGTNRFAPNDVSGTGPTFHVGVRLNELWSLNGGLRYSILSGKLTGVRWTATLEPVFHVIWGLSVSLGAGYGGMSAALRDKRDLDYRRYLDDPAAIDISGRAPAAGRLRRYNNCEGSGFVLLGRAQYLMTVGDIFSTGPEVRFEHQWTHCLDREMEAYLRQDLQELPRQWWNQRSLTYGWVLAWR